MIEYKQTGPHRVPIAVYLNKRHAGSIVRHGDGYRYRPKGSSVYGQTMHTIEAVKRSLEKPRQESNQ